MMNHFREKLFKFNLSVAYSRDYIELIKIKTNPPRNFCCTPPVQSLIISLPVVLEMKNVTQVTDMTFQLCIQFMHLIRKICY
jgi:hypothetical protein